MTRYLWLEIRRSLRDPRYLVLAVVLPLGFYLLFTNLFGSHGEQVQGLPQPVELMIAMAAYGGMWAVFSATAPRIAQEREIGWLRQLRLTPLSTRGAIVAKVAAAMALALPAMLLVCLVAVLVHNVRLAAGEWIALLASMWLATLPLALIGFAIGYLVPSDAAYGVVMALYFALGALGGLWMPLSMLPKLQQTIGHALPSNGLADLGWNIAAGASPLAPNLLVLLAWTLAGAALSLLAYRRAATR